MLSWLIQSKTKCPYCSFVLPEKPKRRSECPSCHRVYFVRLGVPITDIQKLEDDLMLQVGYLHPTMRQIITDQVKQFGFNRSMMDYKHSILNAAILKEKSTSNDPQTLKLMYFSILRSLKAEGKNPEHIYKLLEREIIRNGKREYKAFSKEEAQAMVQDEIDQMRRI